MSSDTEYYIGEICKDKMNSICFDCGAQNPTFISINNGIFLCNQCATVHSYFVPGVSKIENNDLYSLTPNQLKYLASGGNTRLNDFILDEYPKIENYSQKILYKTRAMDYYRKRLDYFVNGGIEPKRPSQIVGCQLIPDDFYSKESHNRKEGKKVDSKTHTYKAENHKKPIRYHLNLNNDGEFNREEDQYIRDPYLKERNYGGNTFKKIFGDDFFGMDDEDDFFKFGGNRLNQTQMFGDNQKYPEKIQHETNNNKREPRDNLSRSMAPGQYAKVEKVRPLTSTHPIFVPSKKHHYVKKDNQNLNKSYNPFQKRDSTDLIVIPGNEEEKLLNKKIREKPNEIPKEFHKKATGLGEIVDTIKEDDENDSSEELDKIVQEKEKQEKEKEKVKEAKLDNGDNYTFKNSIRNKYKKKKSQMEIEEKIKEEESKNKKDRSENANKKFARKLSKMNFSSKNWNINQLGEISTYPIVIEIEG